MGTSVKLPTIGDYDPHTKAKHAILRAYLAAWFPILASIQKAKRVLFLDRFAGPGEYTKGEPGSPAIAMQIAMAHKARFEVPVSLVFIEADKDRHGHLCGVVDRLRLGIASASNRIVVREHRQGAQRAPPGARCAPPGARCAPPGAQRAPPGAQRAPPGAQRAPPGPQRALPGPQHAPMRV